MNSDLFSPEFLPMPSGATLVLRLEMDGRLPSWNEILAMEHWARKKFKDQLAEDFSCVLRAYADGSLINPTCATSTMKIYSDTLRSCLMTRRASALAKSHKGKPAATRKKKSSSKSTSSAPKKTTQWTAPAPEPNPPAQIDDSPFD